MSHVFDVRLASRALGYRAVQVRDYVAAEVDRIGISPSYDQICDATGISSRAKVCRIVKSLEARGMFIRFGGANCPASVHGGKVRRIALNGEQRTASR